MIGKIFNCDKCFDCQVNPDSDKKVDSCGCCKSCYCNKKMTKYNIEIRHNFLIVELPTSDSMVKVVRVGDTVTFTQIINLARETFQPWPIITKLTEFISGTLE